MFEQVYFFNTTITVLTIVPESLNAPDGSSLNIGPRDLSLSYTAHARSLTEDDATATSVPPGASIEYAWMICLASWDFENGGFMTILSNLPFGTNVMKSLITVIAPGHFLASETECFLSSSTRVSDAWLHLAISAAIAPSHALGSRTESEDLMPASSTRRLTTVEGVG